MNRQEQLHVDPSVSELAEAAAPAPGRFSILTVTAGRSRYAHARTIQHHLGGTVVVSDERDDAAVPLGRHAR